MSKTVVALYDDFETARDVVEDLVESGFDRDNISLIAPDHEGRFSRHFEGARDDDDVSAGEGAGFGAVVGALVGLGVALIPGIGPVVAAGPFAAAALAGIGAVAGAATGGIVGALVDLGVPDEEAHYYAEGIRRGGTMVTVTTDDASAPRAQDIMNRHNPIDLDDRVNYWRDSGWNAFEDSAEPYTSDQIMTERQSYDAMPAGDKARFEVIEEDLQVGKREVESGGVRVRSYMTASPVEEQVRLRQEHVRVERRPVDRPATEADMHAFKEGVIEVTEHHEEPVVSKQARVVEEVFIDKDVTEHTETVRDTVRRTDVEVEQMGVQTGRAFDSYETFEPRFRNRWSTRFGSSGYTWDQYRPAYRYGYSLATNNRYQDHDWSRLEPEARRYWEDRNPGTWEQFKDAIHDAWMEVTGQR